MAASSDAFTDKSRGDDSRVVAAFRFVLAFK